MEKRICEICGKEFEPHTHNQKVCSHDCAREKGIERKREARRRENPAAFAPRKCPTCGAEFMPNANKQVFCSPACYKLNWRETHKRPPLATRKCVVCGKEFEPKTGGQKYCSSVCCEIAHGHPNVRERQCTCNRCGKKFTSAWNKQYCQKCASQIIREKKMAQVKVDAVTGKPVKTLSDWAREARECDLDYGNYRALIESGKTYEELKAQADSRSTPNRAHGRIRKAD